MTTSIRLRWRVSAYQRRLVSVAAVALLVALILGRGELVALAVPPLILLWVGRSHSQPTTVELRSWLDIERCFEGDDLVVRLVATADGAFDDVDVSLELHPSFTVVGGNLQRRERGVDSVDLEWTIRPERWGRWSPGRLRLVLRSGGRLLEAVAEQALEQLAVFPYPPAMRNVPAPARLPDRVGDHVSRVAGEGVEFAGVRPYVWGDRLRRINWPATTRRGSLQITEFSAERASDVVVCVDAFTDVGPTGSSSLDLAVRGATGVVQTYLRHHDRVGLIVLGGIIRWMTPDMGQRQFFRVVESVLDAQAAYSEVHPDLGRLPATALPPKSSVVLFSPLLDPRAIEVARDLRERGLPVAVVDVLTTEPEPLGHGALPGLALRLWRLDRLALRQSLNQLGITVLSWNGAEALDVPFAPLHRAWSGL